jgi:non-canonical (house-cleaning) NTP pyrophosphatase
MQWHLVFSQSGVTTTSLVSGFMPPPSLPYSLQGDREAGEAGGVMQSGVGVKAEKPRTGLG